MQETILTLEVGFARHDHTTYRVGLQMFPYQFVGIAIR